MDVTNTLKNPTSIPTNPNDIVQNPDAILGKDDFLKLLLVELQYQDPTDPMDTEKILTQTSELASLEAASNTNKALEELSQTLSSSNQYMAVSAIGKMGSLGTDAITLGETGETHFEIYFPEPASSGTLLFKDSHGNVVKQVEIAGLPAGINAFSWDGTNDEGARLAEGSYSVEVDYITASGNAQKTAFGVYPIESVRFDGGKSYLKLGSQYYPLDVVKEIYEG